MTQHITDEDIESAIEQHGASGQLTIEVIRALLGEIQASFETFWSEHMDGVEAGYLEVVALDGDVVVFADHTGHGWREELDAAVEDDNERTRSVLKTTHHEAARRFSDYSFAQSSPFVVRRPDTAHGERQFTEAVVNGLQRQGLSPAQAWAVYGVDFRGESQTSWADRTGRAVSTISSARTKARRRAPHLAALG